MVRLCVVYFLIFFGHLGLYGQDSLLLNRNFSFEDGLYLSFEQFQSNQPAYSLQEVEIIYTVNPQTLLAQVASLRLRSQQTIDFNQIWGICIKGRPFIQIDRREVGKELASFAGLSIIGRLCFFSYQKPIVVPVEIKAYNPLTGQPFRSGTINRENILNNPLLLDFQSGEMQPFSKSNLLKWVNKDPQVARLVRSLEETDGETLLRALVAFNDRNLIFIKKSSK